MKKLLLISFLALFLSHLSFSQENRYLVFEFIRVETGQTFDYLEYKEFLNQIYHQAASNGDIAGWDFWSLQTGSNNEAFQYATITYYNDPVSMMNGFSTEKLIDIAKQAFPEMDEREISEKIKQSLDIRDLAVRSYMVEIAKSDDTFEMKPGVLASFDLMKAVEGSFEVYEKAEKEIFLPLHEEKIDAGFMESWSLLRTALPAGSEAKSTHMTLNIYSDYMQFFNSLEYEDSPTDIEQEAIEKGLSSRDQKWIYLATLESMVRQ
ncbi:MAG: hypothetical protein WD426_00200 [Anditalea sp.]